MQIVGVVLMKQGIIRRCDARDFEAIWSIINDGAAAYLGVIPQDRFREPYMSREELRDEIAHGVEFWGYQSGDELLGVMGIQDVRDVTLIRHAYVRTNSQKLGVGTKLLAHLQNLTATPVLIGTWADALWAIRFYEKHGFEKVSHEEKERLLRTYWHIPERQVETSVVLADAGWRTKHGT